MQAVQEASAVERWRRLCAQPRLVGRETRARGTSPSSVQVNTFQLPPRLRAPSSSSSAECVRSRAQTRASVRNHRVHPIACRVGHRFDPSCGPRPLASPRKRRAAAAFLLREQAAPTLGGKKGAVWSFVLWALGSLDSPSKGDSDCDFCQAVWTPTASQVFGRRRSNQLVQHRASSRLQLRWFFLPLLSLFACPPRRCAGLPTLPFSPSPRAYMRGIYARTKRIFRPETSSHHTCIILALCCVAPRLRCRQSRLAAWFRPRLHDTDEDP